MKIILDTKITGNDLLNVFSQINHDLFMALKPKFPPMKIIRFDGSKLHNEIHLELGLKPFIQKWVSVITKVQVGEDKSYFIDEGKVLPFPLKSWKHQHIVYRNNGLIMRDEIDYTCGFVLIDLVLKPIFIFLFSQRKPIYQKNLRG